MDVNYKNDEIEIDIFEAFMFLIKKWWIICGGGILCAIFLAIYCCVSRIPIYQSEGKILIINQREEPTSDGQLTVNANMSDDYQAVITSRTVLNQVIENLQLSITYEQLVGRVAVSRVEETRLLVITVSDVDPVQAKKMLDEIQAVSVAYIEEFLEVYAAKVMDVGTIPQGPASAGTFKYALVGFVGGVFGTSFVLLVLFLMDGSVRTEELVKKHLHCETLGIVSSSKIKREAFEALRTNVKAFGSEIQTIVVTNCNEKESSPTIAHELAVSFAENDQRVLFINANLRYCSQDKQYGLTEYLRQSKKLQDVCKETKHKSLFEIHAGGVCDCPSELLDSMAFAELLQNVRGMYDKVVVYGASMDKYIDSAIIAKQCDGTIMIAEKGRTHYKVIQKAMKQLVFVKANVLGCVINAK